MLPTIVLVIVLAMAGIIFGIVVSGASLWRSGTKELRSELIRARSEITPRSFDPGELDPLPPPVRRYFREVLTEGQPLVSSARISHKGRFNMGEDRDKWVPFKSDQLVVTRRPGFDWNGRVRIAPGLHVFIHDAYVAGKGLLLGKILGLLTVVERHGTPEIARGELIRFLAEAAWYPTALMPSQGTRWSAIDDTSARATLTDGDHTVSLEISFDSDGLIDTVRTSGRYRLVKGRSVATPWQGRFWSYEVRDGMKIPLEGEVAWMLPQGPRPYWRGRITDINYDFEN
jgi:hypothetical protein